MTVDEVLAHVQEHLELDAETEYEILEEIRLHLEEAVEAARAQGMDEGEALSKVVARFGLEQVRQELQSTHTGWGTADGVIAAALPVICALVLRWLVFVPDGTAVAWRQMLGRPAFWAVALAALLIPLLKLARWRYALASWALFWSLSVIFVALPAMQW